jgi:hypothetical protein
MKKWLLAMGLVMGALPLAASAQGPFGYWGYGWVDGYGQGRVTSNDNIPYFAAHPPVYYSHEIIRRPMGPSPFAYPGYYMPVQAEVQVIAPAAPAAEEPVVVDNAYFAEKHFGQKSAAAQVSFVQPLSREAAASGTLLIINPFVKR